jgi:hypothetical protein
LAKCRDDCHCSITEYLVRNYQTFWGAHHYDDWQWMTEDWEQIGDGSGDNNFIAFCFGATTRPLLTVVNSTVT